MIIQGEMKGSKENFRNLNTDIKIKFVYKLIKSVKKRIKYSK